VESGQRFPDQSSVGEAVGSRRVSVIVVAHLVHEDVSEDHHLRNRALFLDVRDLASIGHPDVVAQLHAKA
jgi:hypothetical protein